MLFGLVVNHTFSKAAIQVKLYQMTKSEGLNVYTLNHISHTTAQLRFYLEMTCSIEAVKAALT